MNGDLVPRDRSAVTTRGVARPTPTRAMACVIVFWTVYVAILVGASFDFGILPARWSRLGWGSASSAALFLLTFVMVRREGRTLGDVGIGFGRRSVPLFLVGAVIGFATYALNIAVLATAIGGLHLTTAQTTDWSAVALTVGTVLALASMEELGFRGYPLRTLVPQLGPWAAQALIAVAFALTHLLYNWSWSSIVFGVLPSAFLFSAAALASGGLAMPIGLHMAVNLARWALGEQRSSGFFTMTVDPPASARLERIAPVTGIAITLGMATMLWWWDRRSRSAPSG
jgi:membrane protease YdiL (CAAX protease family)